MSKYRKLPVVVDAFKWTGRPDQTEDPLWIVEHIRKSKENPAAWSVRFVRINPSGPVCMEISTPEGRMLAQPGDYVIRGDKNEIYPCKPDIFEATYELVEDAESCPCCGSPIVDGKCEDVGGHFCAYTIN